MQRTHQLTPPMVGVVFRGNKKGLKAHATSSSGNHRQGQGSPHGHGQRWWGQEQCGGASDGDGMHKNKHGKIKTKPVEETITRREDMIRKWNKLRQVLDLLSLYNFTRWEIRW